MWQHEIIDSFLLLKSVAQKELSNVLEACLELLPQAEEFFLGDVDGQKPHIRKYAAEKAGQENLFSVEEGTKLPYNVTLLTFFVKDEGGHRRKLALLLSGGFTETISAVGFCFDPWDLRW